MATVKRYRVNESEHFNLMSMYDHLMCKRDAMREDPCVDADELEAIEDRVAEVSGLLDKAYCVGATVTWPVLARIREIQAERQHIRYSRCLAAGMSEQDAAVALSM